jgi:hypothetical protein
MAVWAEHKPVIFYGVESPRVVLGEQIRGEQHMDGLKRVM